MAKGTRANKRGRTLEDYVAGLLDEGYERVSALRFFALRCLTQPIYAAQVHVGSNIYAKARRVDFIAYHPQRWPNCLVLQCKWQTSRGSVDEKYPFEVESIAAGLYQTIIVLDGGGCSEGARQWLMAQRGKRNLLDVLDMGGISRFQASGRL